MECAQLSRLKGDRFDGRTKRKLANVSSLANPPWKWNLLDWMEGWRREQKEGVQKLSSRLTKKFPETCQ
ncbi:hypothetical protein J4Q44_G00072830 [Coregonus suidteri]|uniref:Uncharacterized protein n=1 Tax=Coregonus suidteri TaxID=861788 RepID=A0AAN8R2Q7_9TELE